MEVIPIHKDNFCLLTHIKSVIKWYNCKMKWIPTIALILIASFSNGQMTNEHNERGMTNEHNLACSYKTVTGAIHIKNLTQNQTSPDI